MGGRLSEADENSGWQQSFEAFARSSFQFLEKHGYRVAESDHGQGWVSIRWVSAEDTSVTVSACPVRLEFNVSFGTGTQDESFSLNMIARTQELSWEPSIGIYSAHQDAKSLENLLDETAALLKTAGEQLLDGSESALNRLRFLRAEDAKGERRRGLSRKAERHFKASEWLQAIEILEELGENRSALQTARLSYARKMANESGE